jgi:hypothetical protein
LEILNKQAGNLSGKASYKKTRKKSSFSSVIDCKTIILFFNDTSSMINVSKRSRVAWLMVALACAACTKEARVGEKPAVDGMITLKVIVPRAFDGEDSMATRAAGPVAGTPDESRIKDIRFFIFKSDKDSLERHVAVTIKEDGTSTNPAWDAASNSLNVTISPGAKRVYCIANWATTPTVEMPDLTPATVKDTAALLARVRVHDGAAPRNPPVMTGRVSRVFAGTERDLTIPLTRQVARVDVYVSIAPVLRLLKARVLIDGVKFARVPKQSFLFETNPPSSPRKGAWEEAAFTGADSVPARDSATLYPTTFYVPENVAAAETEATVMIVKARLNEKVTYYAVALNRVPAAGRPAFVLSRNFCYQYFLTIRGLGSGTIPVIAPASRGDAGAAFENIGCDRVVARQAN